MRQITLEQGTPEWLAFRKERIGASDVPSIMGVGFKTPLQIWKEKKGLTETIDNDRMRRGRELEEPARKKFIEMTGIKMVPIVGTHDQFDYIMASFDGLSSNGDQALEIKCPGIKDHLTAVNGEVPEKYKYQLQQQMYVSGLSVIFYFSFDGTDGTIIEVPRDNKAIDKMLEQEHKFYRDHMLTNISPDPVDKDYLRQMNPERLALAKAYLEDDELIRAAEERNRFRRDALIIMSAGSPTMCDFLKISKIHPKGRIDTEKAISDGIDLERYRKPGKESWRITRN